jgi:hypothetical protein
MPRAPAAIATFPYLRRTILVRFYRIEYSAPAVGEIEDPHVEHEHGIVHSLARLPKLAPVRGGAPQGNGAATLLATEKLKFTAIHFFRFVFRSHFNLVTA